jgi:hypothetical protein
LGLEERRSDAHDGHATSWVRVLVERAAPEDRSGRTVARGRTAIVTANAAPQQLFELIEIVFERRTSVECQIEIFGVLPSGARPLDPLPFELVPIGDPQKER